MINYNEKYLIHVKGCPESVLFSPRYHVKIATVTTDGSVSIIPKVLDTLLKERDGYSSGCAMRYSEGTFEMFSPATVENFLALTGYIKAMG